MRIDVEELFFSYPGNDVLHGVNLQVNQSEIVCVVGPNGSGKSTFIKCVESLLVPKKGTIYLDGIDSQTMHRTEIAKLLGYVPQSTNHFFATTVFDTVMMGRRPYSSWMGSDEDVEEVIEILTKMEIDDIALHNFNHLSGGQQQQVLIARALAQKPKGLLLDEPTSSLDIAHQLEVMDIIHDLVHEHQLCVIMIVHDLNLASRYADRIVMLNDGKIHAAGPPRDVFTVENIEEVYQIEAEIRENKGTISIYPLNRYVR